MLVYFHPEHCIVRVPVLYGFTEPNKYNESAINCLIEKVRQQNSYMVDSVQVRYPTHCIDVARFIIKLIMKNLTVILFLMIDNV
jgi:dTDP-4-dehydrorhamnose reductase